MNKILFSILFLHSVLTAGIAIEGVYFGPSERLIERESWEKVKKKVNKMGVLSELIPYFNSIAETETWGHIGYHGANQGYRVYQDVIRFTIEEILEISVRKNFQFLRIPGTSSLNLNCVDAFFRYWGKNKIDNKSEKRGEQLISLNFGIYSNYDEKGSCSVNLFVNDFSKASINYSKALDPFYQELGISSDALKDLFAIGRKWLNEEGGVLLQISENSHLSDPDIEAYNFADQHCYPCKKGGYVYGSSLISSHFQRIMTDAYLDHKVNIAPQLRLLMNNRYTLNPYSHLIVNRWDFYDLERIAMYETEMRESIRSMDFDPVKAKKYRENLLDTWLYTQ